MNQLSEGLKKLQQLHEDGNDFRKTCQGIVENPTPGTKTCSQTTTFTAETTPVNGQAIAKGSYLSRKIFIGNISFRVTPAQLKNFLSKFGEVTNVHIINDHVKHLSKGIAFATFANAEMASEAKRAKAEDLELDGREIRISQAEERRIYKMRSKKRLQKAPLDLINKDELPDSSGNNMLNDDVMMLILKYLNMTELLEVENVCKRWKSVAQSVWASYRTLKFSKVFSSFMQDPILDDDLLEKFLLRCPKLKTLDIEDVAHNLTFRTSEIISELCVELENLKLGHVDITNRGMELLSEKCSNLKVVRLKRCHNIGEKGFWYLMKNCQNLEYFEISDNSKITGQCLENVSPNFKALVISSCSKFWAFHRISKRCKNLQTLKLNYTAHSLTDKHLEDILNSCLSIENFELIKVSSPITSRGLLHLASLSHLKCLTLYEQYAAVYDEVLIAISKNCKALSTLDVSKCYELTDIGVESLKRLPHLQHLTLNFIPSLTSGPLKAIAANGQLVTLSMISCCIEDISGPVQVLTLCPNMTMLNMADNRSITTSMMEQCLNAIQRREETHKISITCGGCNVEIEDLNVPLYVEINWYSYVEGYYSDDLDSASEPDDDYYDDEDAYDDPYEDEYDGHGPELPEFVYDDLYEPNIEDLDII